MKLLRSLAAADATATRKAREARVRCIMRTLREKEETSQYSAAIVADGIATATAAARGEAGLLPPPPDSSVFVCKLALVLGRDLFSPISRVHENNRHVLVSMSGSTGD